MPCPLCRKEFAIPANGLISLPKNFYLENAKELTTTLELSKIIQKIALRTSRYAEELLSKRRILEQRKKHILSTIDETKCEIRQRTEEQKAMIDKHMESLLEKLNQIKQKQIEEFDSEESKIQCNYTILKRLETNCNEVTSQGSASDICRSAYELKTKAAELERDTEAFIGRPSQSTKIFFQATDLEVLLNSSGGNIVGNIHG